MPSDLGLTARGRLISAFAMLELSSRGFTARCHRRRSLSASNTMPANTKSNAVGAEITSPVISVFLITANYGATVRETLRQAANLSLPERNLCCLGLGH